jgi:hypothetical protein
MKSMREVGLSLIESGVIEAEQRRGCGSVGAHSDERRLAGNGKKPNELLGPSRPLVRDQCADCIAATAQGSTILFHPRKQPTDG